MTEIALGNDYQFGAELFRKAELVTESIGSRSGVGRSKVPENWVRFQVILSQDALERLDSLKGQINATTRVEVLRNALKAYDLIANEIAKGNEILIQEKNGAVSKLKVAI